VEIEIAETVAAVIANPASLAVLPPKPRSTAWMIHLLMTRLLNSMPMRTSPSFSLANLSPNIARVEKSRSLQSPSLLRST
jgi:hypothetical protein